MVECRLGFKKTLIFLMIFSLAIFDLSHAATDGGVAEPWWFFTLELFGLFMVISLVLMISAKLPDKKSSARKGIRKMFISNIIGFSVLGVALVTRSYSETQGVSEFAAGLIFEILLYVSLLFFIFGISSYHDEDGNSL